MSQPLPSKTLANDLSLSSLFLFFLDGLGVVLGVFFHPRHGFS